MTEKDAEFLKRLLVTFKVEADEHLQEMYADLLRLEKDEDTAEERAKLVEAIFREAHSLKGAARAVNLREIESFCQALEGSFAALKKGEITMSTGLFDLLQEALDFLGLALAKAEAERTREEQTRQRQLIARLTGAAKGEIIPAERLRKDDAITAGKKEPSPSPLPPEPLPSRLADLPFRQPADSQTQRPPAQETVRVSTARLSSVLLQAEEMLLAKLASSQRAHDLRTANTAFGTWKKEWAKVRPLAQRLRPLLHGAQGAIKSGEQQRALLRLLDFLDWNGDLVTGLDMRFRAEAKAAERDSRALSGMVNNLLDDMKKVLMFPFASLLEILPKIVRDLSRDKGKQIELLIEGGELEIDRRILEEMKDPLIHLVRNCIDHGIEPPAERKAKGKPARGTIRITVSPRDDKVELIIADDGGGIPLAAVRSALHKSGTSSGERLGELGDQELVPYIFQSGISTSAIITEISGRGLGLAIVREKVEKLGGTVSVKTSPGSGTTFHIVLPLTVATFRGLLVRVGGEALFVLPTMYIERVVRLQREAIGTVENRETISLEGSPVSLAHLAEVLELPPAQTAPAPSDLLSMVVLAASGTHIAFLVDEVVGEQEVLLKGFGRQLSRVRNVAGATVLGNGRVAPILNVADLLKSAAKRSTFATGHDLRAESREGTAQRRTVMVVEDSITTRTLLQNILETAGFGVVTAVDGVDALTKLKGGSFDIVVSDVDMPRMNGFELTSRIRGDKNMEELPVVLVTALATREDQERGIDAGADAYIVKSSFDQSNLLEVIEQLV